MKRILVVIAIVSIFGCATQQEASRAPSSTSIGHTPNPDSKIPTVCLYALDDHMRRVTKSLGKEPPEGADPCSWTPPVALAKAQPLPVVQSERHQKEIDASMRLYEEGKYVEAARAVHAAVKDEPENEFLLECYARALYRTDSYRQSSFEIYKRLITLLDRKEEPSNIGMDVWFVEAYWKYGTLLMDRHEWEKAAFEISRALATSYMVNQGQAFALQAYSYLAEAYFHMGRYDVAKYYAEVALQINPKNEYAQYYLDRAKDKLH
jgi:tetratricopeptide (TPR) repeat protein